MKTSGKAADAVRLWRKRMDLSIQQAAKALGKTDRMIRYMDHGQSRPQADTKMLMSAIAKGIRLEPWNQ
jgi:DNA-binding transcriptional regulator YiaG